jgi:hypothetical protein
MFPTNGKKGTLLQKKKGNLQSQTLVKGVIKTLSSCQNKKFRLLRCTKVIIKLYDDNILKIGLRK